MHGHGDVGEMCAGAPQEEYTLTADGVTQPSMNTPTLLHATLGPPQPTVRWTDALKRGTLIRSALGTLCGRCAPV
eukprot:COSAG01_NODE_2050_length_8556_cov_63.294312_8_plen_75_part_00